MESDTDRKGNTYFEVNNLRITSIPETWNDDPGIRIQAYKPEGGLHRGAEIPIPDKETGYDLLNAIHNALGENGL